MTANSPYQNLPDTAFWSRTAARRGAGDVAGFYEPRFRIDPSTAKIVTAGSCFAQHVGRALGGAGFTVLDGEKLPWVVAPDVGEALGYGLYSARYGNIYTMRQLRQLVEEALDGRPLAEPVWAREGRFHDAQRPGVEPEGLASADLVLAHRRHHLGRVAWVLSKASHLVFTLGLTEAWMDAEGTTVYPTAPGTIAGSYDPSRHAFRNFRMGEVVADFLAVRERLQRLNPAMRFLLTVSPVPLTATASGQHVEVATAQSKAVLRAAVAEIVADCADVDYFPSYEIITAQAARGGFFAANLRSVTPEGVATAMNGFLAAQLGQALAGGPMRDSEQAAADAVCEEVLLDGFAPK